MQVRFRPFAVTLLLVLSVSVSGAQIDVVSSQENPATADLAGVLGIPKKPATPGAVKLAPLGTSPGIPIDMAANSAFSAAVITNVGGQGVNLLGDWDGQEDLVAEHSGRVANMLTPGVVLTRAAISEHTIANGFPEDVFYYGDSAGNVYVAATAAGGSATLTQIPPSPNLITLNVPAILANIGIVPGDGQMVITGIAVNPVADLTGFANAFASYSFFNGKIGEVLYVTFAVNEGMLVGGQTARSGLLAFPISDVPSPAQSLPWIQSNTGYPITVGGPRPVVFSVFSNVAGVAVDDDGSVYFQQVDLVQRTGANIVKAVDGGTFRDRALIATTITTLTTLNPPAGIYQSLSGPASQVNAFYSYSGNSPVWGNIAALATGPGNVLYAAVSRSFVATDDAATQNTEGLFTNSAALGPTPSMIISFADASGLNDSCSNGANPGIFPIPNNIADAAANGLSISPGVNNFRVFAMGDGPDIRAAAGANSPVLGTVADTPKIAFQVDQTIYSGLTVDEEGSVYVVSGGTPAGVGRNPSPNLGEVLLFPDSAPADRRADFIDLRSDAPPNPPVSTNVGDGDSDRFDHIYWQAPIDETTLTPEAISGLARGFLLYLNRLRTADNTPNLPNGAVQGDDDTSGPINFSDLDPGQQVAGGDDQNSPFRGDDDDGAGSPGLAPVRQGGFEFTLISGSGTSVWNGFFLNSNGNITFGVGDTDNTPTTAEFLGGAARVAPAWGDLNLNARAVTQLAFPVQAIGFAGVNDFKIRWIGVPMFAMEPCGNINTFAVSLFDDGTASDENANQSLNPANPIGNNSVAFDQQEGPTARRYVLTTTGVLVGLHPRLASSGNFTFTYGRMEAVGGTLEPLIVGYSAGGTSILNPNQQALNLSQQAPAIDPYSMFGIYEVFNTGIDTFPWVPSFDLRFEGNDAAAATPPGQPDLNKGVLPFASLYNLAAMHSVPFTDDPLVPGVTVVKAVHVNELRTRIDAQRTRVNLPAFTYTDPNPALGTLITPRYTLELRTALSQVFPVYNYPTPTFTDPTLVPGMPVKALHIMQIRNSLAALEAQ